VRPLGEKSITVSCACCKRKNLVKENKESFRCRNCGLAQTVNNNEVNIPNIFFKVCRKNIQFRKASHAS